MDKWYLIENQNQLASPTEEGSLSRTYLLELNFELRSKYYYIAKQRESCLACQPLLTKLIFHYLIIQS